MADIRTWPLVASHDRPPSCWIFYTSTGSKWHCPEVNASTSTAAKQSLEKNICIASKQKLGKSNTRRIAVLCERRL